MFSCPGHIIIHQVLKTVRNTHVQPILSPKELNSHEPDRAYTVAPYMCYPTEAVFTHVHGI